MVTLAGYLLREGLKLKREQVRASLRRVNPEGVAGRKVGLRWINRRQYVCKRPNEVWHVDGHHKLIRHVD